MPPTRQSSYSVERESLRPGDVIAFVGRRGLFSKAIRFFTGKPTHVAPFAWLHEDRERAVLVEALEGRGVISSYLSERIEGYDGEIYILKLDTTHRFDPEKSAKYLREMIGTPYSMFGALFSAFGHWFRWGGKAMLDSVFCSKLAWFALYCGGLLRLFLGNDETPTPNQLMRLRIWSEFVQIHGIPKELK